MKKVIKLTESDLEQIVKRVLKEQILSEQPTLDFGLSPNGPQTLQDTSGTIVKKGIGGDPYVYAKLGNDYYYTKSSDGNNPNWVLAVNQGAINSIKSKIYDETIPPVKTIKLPKKGETKIQKKKITDKVEVNKTVIDKTKVKKTDVDKIKLADKKTGGAKILKKLKDQGFTVDLSEGFEKDKGYFVSACKEKGCAQFTNNMLNSSLGDAWQAYSKVNAEVNISPSVVKQMTTLFNKMNKSGEIPQLEKKGVFDSEAELIVRQLIPNQSKFKNLPIGTVVGLYFPGSVNYDLAFFQSAIGKSRDENGQLHDVISKPYFCKNPNECSSTVWTQNDLKKNVKFYPGNTLSSGKAFAPNTHLGFIGYIDKNGVPYVVHNVHQQVFAYPVTKLGGGGLSIVWSSGTV
jgi:hypothetical protein